MSSCYKAYTGKILDINLTLKTIQTYPLSDRDRRLFLGGRFISTKILWDELKPGVDPLSPENILVIMTGPLTGTGAPSSSRYDISAKSPLTGAIGHSNSGGHFGIFLKKAGWDGLIIRGAANEPVFIDIHNHHVSIESARHLWGLDTQSAQQAMGSKGGKLVIGPAGENLVLYATVVSQERSHGRTGMGAVMGAKRLKGIVARGNYKIQLSEPEAYKKTVKAWYHQLRNHPATGNFAPTYGTAGFLSILNSNQGLPTKNFSSGSFDFADQISGERLAEKYLIKNSGCMTCPIRCTRIVELDGKQVKGPEYEILCMMGSNLLIHDMDAIIRMNYILDCLGMDTISVGNVLGFAAELNEKGYWKNGIQFGDVPTIMSLLEDIAYRRGIGNDLADGVQRLSQKYGGESFAAHVKGLEIAAYEPRAAKGHALGYATANRGACHLDGGYIVYLEILGPIKLEPLHEKSKPAWVRLNQNMLSAVSAAGNCLFTSWTFIPGPAFTIPDHKKLSRMITTILTQSWPILDLTLRYIPKWLPFHFSAIPHTRAIQEATGMKMDFSRFFLVGERGITLERRFNLREGLSHKDDTLPQKFISQKLLHDVPQSKVPINDLLKKYYRIRGWDSKGVPK